MAFLLVLACRSDIYVETDFQVPDVSGKADGVIVASRVTNGGCGITLAFGLIFELNLKTQTFKLITNFRKYMPRLFKVVRVAFPHLSEKK